MPTWNTNQIPDQSGKTIVITGATSGLGLCCAETLAGCGAHIIMAVRNPDKAAEAVRIIRQQNPTASVAFEQLNLASLASIAAFATRMNNANTRIDVLLNNAGLGLRAEKPRIVTVASIAHRRGAIHWADPNFATGYSGRTSYNQSKLANLMFALQLAARATAQCSRIESLAAHPGLSLTGFLAATRLPAYQQQIGILASKLIGQTAQAGSWPLLYAAAMPDARNGEYWGPNGFLEIRGIPAFAKSWPQAIVQADQERLWNLSESLTGIVFPLLG